MLPQLCILPRVGGEGMMATQRSLLEELTSS